MAEPSRRTGLRLRSLTGTSKWIVWGTLAVFAIAPIIAAITTISAGWQATGDVAVIGLRSRDAWTSHAPLVGLTTTGQELTGTQANHPGPIEFWALGLTTRLFGGRAGMVLGAALINAGALTGIVWLAFRRGGTVLLALTSVALACLIRSLTSASLHDVFNPELTTFPMLLALFAAWSVLVGDLRISLVLVAAASVAAQIHLAGTGFVAPLVLVGVGSVGWAWRKHPGTVRREAPWLLGSAALGLVLWLPVIMNELSSGPSNVAALWKVATVPRAKIGLAFITERLAYAVAPVPTFVRSTGRLGFLHDAAPLGVLAAALVLGGGATLALLVRQRTGRRDVAQLAALLLLSAATSLWLGSTQPPLSAFRADGTRWLWIVSLMAWLVVAWSGWLLLADAAQDRIRPVVAPVGAVLTVVLLVVALGATGLKDQRDGGIMPATDEASTAALAAVPKGTYHLQFEGNLALITAGPGIAYRFEEAGRQVRVDDNLFGRAFGAERIKSGPVDGNVRITSGTNDRAAQGEKLVAEVPVDGGTGSTIRVFVRP